MLTGKTFLECSSYFSIMHLIVLYIVANYFLGFFVKSGRQTRQTDRETDRQRDRQIENSTGGLKNW